MHQYRGRLVLHTGSMFSGKTSSLRRDINRFIIAGYSTLVLKPKKDNKSYQSKLLTHDHVEMDAIVVEDIKELDLKVDIINPDIVAVDEIHQLKGSLEDIVEVFNKYLKKDKTLVLSGIDLDSEGRPFPIMKELMPRADYIHKHHAVCVACGVDSWVSSRIEEGLDTINGEFYEPLCRTCFYKNKKK